MFGSFKKLVVTASIVLASVVPTFAGEARTQSAPAAISSVEDSALNLHTSLRLVGRTATRYTLEGRVVIGNSGRQAAANAFLQLQGTQVAGPESEEGTLFSWGAQARLYSFYGSTDEVSETSGTTPLPTDWELPYVQPRSIRLYKVVKGQLILAEQPKDIQSVFKGWISLGRIEPGTAGTRVLIYQAIGRININAPSDEGSHT